MNIRPLVERILTLYGEYIHEIIPVNDGSTDRTAEVMRQLAAEDDRIKPLHRVPPNGVGLAIRDGLAAATGALRADDGLRFPAPSAGVSRFIRLRR